MAKQSLYKLASRLLEELNKVPAPDARRVVKSIALLILRPADAMWVVKVLTGKPNA